MGVCQRQGPITPFSKAIHGQQFRREGAGEIQFKFICIMPQMAGRESFIHGTFSKSVGSLPHYLSAPHCDFPPKSAPAWMCHFPHPVFPVVFPVTPSSSRFLLLLCPLNLPSVTGPCPAQLETHDVSRWQQEGDIFLPQRPPTLPSPSIAPWRTQCIQFK